MTQKALIKALKNEGISICSKGECTRNVRVFGKTKRLLCIAKDTLQESGIDDLPDEGGDENADLELPFGSGEIAES